MKKQFKHGMANWRESIKNMMQFENLRAPRIELGANLKVKRASTYETLRFIYDWTVQSSVKRYVAKSKQREPMEMLCGRMRGQIRTKP